MPTYPENWENLRWWIKRRDNLQCVECGSRRNLHVHHIIPLSRGGSNHPTNLQTLCENCHTEKHPHMLAQQITHQQSTTHSPIETIFILTIILLFVATLYTTMMLTLFIITIQIINLTLN